jgi:hypothetical protein
MSRPKAVSRAAASNVAASLAALLSPARAEASRNNGAKSKGPKTAEGKARSSRNALRHGLCAEKHVVVEGESPEAFAAFEAALLDDLAPEGALQALLAGRIARAAWRLERAERIEAELFAREMDGPFGGGDLGHALIRDCNGARAFDTLLRYRGAAQAEFSRALRLLKALQAEAAEVAAPRRRARAQLEAAPEPALPEALPSKPEARSNPGETLPTAGADKAAAVRDTQQAARTAKPAIGHASIVPGRQTDRTRHLQESWRDRPGGRGGLRKPSRSDRDEPALGRPQGIGTVAEQRLDQARGGEERRILPAAALGAEHPAIAEMHLERAEQDRHQRQRDPARVDPEDQQRTADQLGCDGQIGEPAGKADRLEESYRARQGEHEYLQERVRDKHDAERETQHERRIGCGGRVDGRVGHDRSPLTSRVGWRACRMGSRRRNGAVRNRLGPLRNQYAYGSLDWFPDASIERPS